jgi:hypothetical protein
MGGTYWDWLRYQEKEQRQRRREEKQALAYRVARNRPRAAKAARTRRKRRQAQQVSSALHGLLVVGVAVVLLVAGTIIRQAWRTWR